MLVPYSACHSPGCQSAYLYPTLRWFTSVGTLAPGPRYLLRLSVTVPRYRRSGPFKPVTYVRIVSSKYVYTANLLPLLRKSMFRANPSSDLSTHAVSPLALLRFQAWRKVMGIELRLSRAPGFVISKGPGRFQALSLHAMSWHLTHKVALVLAYLQAVDSDCQQQGENEWEWNRSRNPAASFRKTLHLRLLRSPLSSDSLWTSRPSLQRLKEVEFTHAFLVHFLYLCWWPQEKKK